MSKSEGYIYLSEWSRKKGIPYATAWHRAKRGEVKTRNYGGRVYVKEWEDGEIEELLSQPAVPLLQEPSLKEVTNCTCHFCSELAAMRKRHDEELQELIMRLFDGR